MPHTEQIALERTFEELVGIGEAWPNEDKVVDSVMRMLVEAEVDEFECTENGTIIGRIEGKNTQGRELGLCSHVDIAVPFTDGEIVFDGDWIRTDGTRILGGDDKTAVAAMLCMAKYFKVRNIKPSRDIVMFFTAGEEAGLHGAASLSAGQVPRDTLVFDWIGGVNQVVERSPAMRKIDVRLLGRAAHAGLYHEGINAGAALTEACAALNSRQGRSPDGVNFLIGQLEAGAARNQVPQDAALAAEVRGHDLAAVDRFAEEVSGQFRTTAKDWGVTASVDIVKQSDPFVLNKQTGLYELAVGALGELGLEPEHVDSFGCYDTNIFDALPGHNAMTMGGAYYNPHTFEESVNRTQFLELYEYMKLVATR